MTSIRRPLLVTAVLLMIAGGGWAWVTRPARLARAAAPWLQPWWPTAVGLTLFDIDPFPTTPSTGPREAGMQIQGLLRPLDETTPAGFAESGRERLDSIWTPAIREALEQDVGPLTAEAGRDRMRQALRDSLPGPALRAIEGLPYHGRAGRFAALGSLRAIDLEGPRYAAQPPADPTAALRARPLDPIALTDMSSAWFLTAAYQQSVGRPRGALQALTQASWAHALWARSAADPQEVAIAAEWGGPLVGSMLDALAQSADSGFARRARARWDSLQTVIPPPADAPSGWGPPSASFARIAAIDLPSYAPVTAWWQQYLLQRVAEVCGGGAPPTRPMASLPGMSAVPLWVRTAWEADLTPPATGYFARRAWCLRLLDAPPWAAIRP